MGNLSDMIIAALSQVWHLIPIVVAVILFRKFINSRDKKIVINKNIENEKNGLTIELRTIKKYEDLEYKVIFYPIDDEKYQGIDLVCNKDNKTFLIKCNNSSKSKSITEKDIKIFHKDAMKYVKTNDISKNDVEFRYVILFNDALDKSAIKILKNDSYNCRYVILSN